MNPTFVESRISSDVKPENRRKRRDFRDVRGDIERLRTAIRGRVASTIGEEFIIAVFLGTIVIFPPTPDRHRGRTYTCISQLVGSANPRNLQRTKQPVLEPPPVVVTPTDQLSLQVVPAGEQFTLELMGIPVAGLALDIDENRVIWR